MVGAVGNYDAAERVRDSIEKVSKIVSGGQDEAVANATKAVKVEAQVQSDGAKLKTAQDVLDQLLS